MPQNFDNVHFIWKIQIKLALEVHLADYVERILLISMDNNYN